MFTELKERNFISLNKSPEQDWIFSISCCCCCCCVASVMSDSVRPHRRQPTRLPRPRDSPDKNTGVGCHFLLQGMKVKSESEVAQLCPTQRPHGLQPTRLLHPWDFPGKSTGVGCHCILWSHVWAIIIISLLVFANCLFLSDLSYTLPHI